MKWSAPIVIGLLWLAPAEAKLRTPKSQAAAAQRNITPRAKHLKLKKFKPTGHTKSKRYSKSQIAKRHD